MTQTSSAACKSCSSEQWLTATLSKLAILLLDYGAGSGPDSTYPSLELTAK